MEDYTLGEIIEDINEETLLKMSYEWLMENLFLDNEVLRNIRESSSFWKKKMEYEISSRSYESLEDILLDSCELGRFAFVVMLVEIYGADITENDEYFLNMALKNGHIKIFKYIIEKTLSAKVSSHYLSIAIKKDYYELVKFILDHNYHYINTINASVIIKAAVESNMTKMLKLLINYELFKNAEKDEALLISTRKDNVEMTKILLKDHNLDPSYDNNKALKNACQSDSITILKLILENERTIISQEDSNSIIDNILDDTSDPARIITVLLMNKKINFSESGHNILDLMVAEQNLRLVKLVLSRDDIDSFGKVSKIVEQAYNDGNTNIVKLLIQDERIRSKLTEDEIEKFEDK